jgi:hypothetical protein
MTEIENFLRKKGISFQTSDNFKDWLVDTTEAEIVSAINDFVAIKQSELLGSLQTHIESFLKKQSYPAEHYEKVVCKTKGKGFCRHEAPNGECRFEWSCGHKIIEIR